MALTEPAVLVLTALVGEPRHGYALIAEVQGLSAGRVTLSVGTLYGLLDRLTGEGLIARDGEEVHEGPDLVPGLVELLFQTLAD